MTGVHDAVDRVTAALQQKAALLYNVFDYYAALGLEVKDIHGEVGVNLS